MLRHILGRSGQKKLNKLISRRIINSLTKSSRGSSNLLFEEIVSQVFLSHYKRLFTLLLVASSVSPEWGSDVPGCRRMLVVTWFKKQSVVVRGGPRFDLSRVSKSTQWGVTFGQTQAFCVASRWCKVATLNVSKFSSSSRHGPWIFAGNSVRCFEFVS